MSIVVRKPEFCKCENKTQISFAVTAKLISAFVFATRTVQFLYYLNPKFQASSHFLWLYSLVCVGPGRKPRRPVFSQRGSSLHERMCAIQGLIMGLLAYKMDILQTEQHQPVPNKIGAGRIMKPAFCICKNKTCFLHMHKQRHRSAARCNGPRHS